jgi:hypothetical protein
MSLKNNSKSKRVPNDRGEQLERKPGTRERFRASCTSPRCTAVREKRPNSWAFQGRLADGETVRIGHVGGGKGTRVKHSLSCVQRLRITHHRTNFWGTPDSPGAAGAAVRGLQSGLRSGPRAGRQHYCRGAPRTSPRRYPCSRPPLVPSRTIPAVDLVCAAEKGRSPARRR